MGDTDTKRNLNRPTGPPPPKILTADAPLEERAAHFFAEADKLRCARPTYVAKPGSAAALLYPTQEQINLGRTQTYLKGKTY